MSTMLNKLKEAARVTQQSGFRAIMEMAQDKNCVNLGPGLCNLQLHPRVLRAAQKAMAAEPHYYTECDGVPPLKSAITQRYAAYNQLAITPANVLVTCGATGGFESICKGFLEPGDEVIMFEPFYQYHARQVLERGATVRYVKLDPPAWSLSLQELAAAVTKETKFLVMANPNNPTGKVFAREELEGIADICREAGIFAVCDEVYEYLVRPGHPHLSLAGLPGMFDHTLTLSSAGKTFQVTGWRVGWLIGPENVIGRLAVKADETYLCAPAPLQYAVAECLSFEDGFFSEIQMSFEGKRSRIVAALREAGFSPQASDGAFYVLAGYQELGYPDDLEATIGLIRDFGIMTIPGSVFCSKGSNLNMLRFCFAVEDDALNLACDRLRSGVANPVC